ncbi:MAG: hypothetical protein JKY12_02355 [Sneathiella sp.]|nr:hypothetical protein [Sneathiella sp.]
MILARYIFLSAIFLTFTTTADITTASPDTENNFSFNVISDIPYNREQEELLVQEIIPALRSSDAPFTIHLGDFKAGDTVCSDSLFRKRQVQISQMHLKYVIYTPGDNEWTDCDRGGDSEIERLAKIREMFFTNLPSFPDSWTPTRQEGFPENFRWIYKNVAFSTVHIVGTNNGRIQIKEDDIDEALQLVDARDKANQTWTDTLFKAAANQNAKAVLIALQADLSNSRYEGECTPEKPRICDGYFLVKKQLIQAAKDFKKPILILHGDTGPYCMDKKFGGADAPNLWRFNSGGDYRLLDAVKITVSPDDSLTPFSMESLREHITPSAAC